MTSSDGTPDISCEFENPSGRLWPAIAARSWRWIHQIRTVHIWCDSRMVSSFDTGKVKSNTLTGVERESWPRE